MLMGIVFCVLHDKNIIHRDNIYLIHALRLKVVEILDVSRDLGMACAGERTRNTYLYRFFKV